MFKQIVKLATTAALALGLAFSAQAHADAHGKGMHSGEVLDTVNGGGYTYVQIKEEGKLIWAAAPQTEVKKGDVVEFDEQMSFPSFESKTLKRSFAPLIFAGKIAVK